MRVLLIFTLILSQSCMQFSVKNATICDGIEAAQPGSIQTESFEQEPAGTEKDGGDQLLLLNRMMNTL